MGAATVAKMRQISMRKVQFVNDEYYHIYNRGVDKRDIFLCDDDFWRCYVSMFLFNDENFRILRGLGNSPHLSCGYCRSLGAESAEKKNITPRLFVDILSFCLMPNHYHLFVKQLIDNGISLFMQRLNQGFTNYFNCKYDRTGRLFEGPFKAVHINHEGQFLHLPRYIHLNAVDLVEPNWREKGVRDWKEVLNFMESYKWSSHGVYLGKPQPIKVVNPSFLREVFKTPENYLGFVKSWAVKGWESVSDFCVEELPHPSCGNHYCRSLGAAR